MKIAFLGSRGIPNDYGGFEQFTQHIAVRLAERGHEVTVYCPTYHPFREDVFCGVRLTHIYSPEPWLGAAPGAMVYDFLCLRHALGEGFDVICETGYTSIAPAYLALGVKWRKGVALVTNMDGMEFRRGKFGMLAKLFLQFSEKVAVGFSHHLIADNMGIRDYYREKYSRRAEYLAYGADIPQDTDESLIRQFNVKKDAFFLVIARIEPENNIEMIADGFLSSEACRMPLLIVGKTNTSHAKRLAKKYADCRNVVFVGGIYDNNVLNALRANCRLYFHGHSVGGTNPSLLEAMACRSRIAAHDNVFNRSVLGANALYFGSCDDVRSVADIHQHCAEWGELTENNIRTIDERYSWTRLTDDYEAFFRKISDNR